MKPINMYNIYSKGKHIGTCNQRGMFAAMGEGKDWEFYPVGHDLTPAERAVAKNLKTGLAIFLIMALIGMVLDILT